MTRPQPIGIRRRLNALLPPGTLERLATESRFFPRRRKLEPVATLWTLTLGFGAGRTRSLAALRRLCNFTVFYGRTQWCNCASYFNFA